MKEMDGIKAAIFDLDGTLIDSMGAWHEADVQFLTRRGLPLEQDYFDLIKTMSFAIAADYTIERYKLGDSPEEVIAEWRGYVQDEYDHSIPLKDGAIEYLAHLKSRGVKIALATSNELPLCEGALRRLGIDRFADALTFTHEAARPKSFPDVYLLAAERLGASVSETAVFEDAFVGVKSAKSGGFFTVAVYDDASAHDWEDMSAAADLAVRDLRELIR